MSEEPENNLFKLKKYQIRPIFISFHHFAFEWRNLPFQVLTESILCFPTIKRSWIFPSTPREREEGLRNCEYLYKHGIITSHFLSILNLKECQNLLFWAPLSLDDSLPSLPSSNTTSNTSTQSSTLDLDKSPTERRRRNSTYVIKKNVRI